MIIEVVYAVDGSVQPATFTCKHASRKIHNGGIGVILFPDGTGRDHKGRKVLSAQYAHVQSIVTYDED